MLAADGLAMAGALEPGIVTHGEERHVEIELDGRHTRGATVVDWDGRSGKAANARIALAVDQSRFEALVSSALGVVN
jgi:purine nucleosidase